MSKTHKTRPLLVRMGDKKDNGAGFTEVHDHVDRACDLPSSPKEQFELSKRSVDHGCHFEFKYTGHSLCSCPMCSQTFEKRKIVKKARQSGKRSAIDEQLG